MRKKRIALVFGMEDTFPWALIDAINSRGGDQVEAMPAEISYLKDDGVFCARHQPQGQVRSRALRPAVRI